MVDRTQRILLRLMNSDGPLTSQELAAGIGVSSRTIIAEMPAVSRVLAENGARLVSRRNWGYAVEVTDEVRYEAFRADLDMLAMQIGVAGYDENERFLYAARRIIAAPEGVLLDDIAEELSVSRSALRKPLRRAYDFLKSHHLRVVPLPGRGVKAVGCEYLLRFAMTELFAAHFHKARLTGVDAGYARIIACDWQERQDIRHVYLAIQRESGWPLRDSRTQRVAMLLVISRNRDRDGCAVHLPPAWVEELACSPLFEVARRVLGELASRFEGFDPSDESACALLAMYMLCSLSPAALARAPFVAPPFERDLARALEAVDAETARMFGFNPFAGDPAREMIRGILLPVLVAARYGWDGHEMFDHENERLIGASPLCMAFASQLARSLGARLGCRISGSVLLLLASAVEAELARCSYEVRPLRVLVTDGMGSEFARCKGERLREAFPDLIASVDAFELYEVRGLDTSAYDLVLTDSLAVSYNYAYPMANLRLVDGCGGYAAIRDRVLVDAYRLEGLLFPDDCMRARKVASPSSLDDLLRRLEVPAGRRGTVRDTVDAVRGFGEAAVPVLVDFVDEQEDERLELLELTGATVASWSRAHRAVYAAVRCATGERHVKAVERLLFLLAQGVPDDIFDDPAQGCRRLLRRSLSVNQKDC